MKLRLIRAGMAALSMLAISISAQAADGPRPVYKARPAPAPVVPVANYAIWAGPYVGLVFGYGWGTSAWEVPAGVSASPSGLMLGGTIGYNQQIGGAVLGFEADWSWSGMKGSVVCGAFTCETAQRSLATLRGRLGIPVDRALAYFTGGFAYGDIRASVTNPVLVGGSRSDWGWTVGGGLEMAIQPNLSAKFEYLYVDMGSFDCGANCFAGTTVNHINLRENIFRIGLNYKLNGLGGGPISARY